MRWGNLIPAFAFLLAIDARDASACSCTQPGPPCQNYFQSDVVFVGTVRSVTRIPGAQTDARVRVEFEDAVPSRGAAGASMTVFTSDGSASCGYAFERGERYVVYAYRSKDGTRVHTSICSRTRPLAEGDEDVTFFQTLSAPASGARVFGSINRRDREPATGDPRDAGPVGNVVLTLSGTSGSFQARTGPDGRYDLTGVPPGTYLLIGVPPPSFSAEPLRAVVELRDARACHQADFGIRYDTRIRGSIVDAGARPVANASVEVIPTALIGTGIVREPDQTRTDAAGHFEFTEMPAGRYILGVNLTQSPDSDIVSPTRFHPDASDPAKAVPFEVRDGERLQLPRMVIPPAPPSYRITGVVTFADGKPAAGASVSLSDGHQSWKRVSTIIRTGADGRFAFDVHEGLSYMAHASYSDPRTPGRTRALATVSFIASETERQTLELVLSRR